MNRLVCIITGPEHNGTTYLKNILDSHPKIYSGFETGLLLNDNFEKSVPFKNWVYHGNFQWGLPKNINLFDNTLTINDKYSLLLHNKGSYEGIIQNLIKKSEYIIDKTPAYFKKLPEVHKRLDNKDIPIIVTIKYFKECYNSLVKKRNINLNVFEKKILKYRDVMLWLKKNKKQLTNIYLFSYIDIIKPNFIKKIKKIIEGRIDVNCEISYNNYLEKTKDHGDIMNKKPYANWKQRQLMPIPNKFKQLEIEYYNLINELKEQI